MQHVSVAIQCSIVAGILVVLVSRACANVADHDCQRCNAMQRKQLFQEL